MYNQSTALTVYVNNSYDHALLEFPRASDEMKEPKHYFSVLHAEFGTLCLF